MVHAPLAIFLAGIEHEGVLAHENRGDQCRHGLQSVAGKESAGDALLIMVLQEIEHVVGNIVNSLPGTSDGTHMIG